MSEDNLGYTGLDMLTGPITFNLGGAPKVAKTFDRSIEDEQDRLLAKMSSLDVSSDEYETVAKRLEQNVRLQQTVRELDIREMHEQNQVRQLDDAMRINPNTVVASGVSLLAILVILNYERLHALTSKAMPLAMKVLPKVI